MASTDAFALKNSDLNTFLFADVGTELNGSALTILSMLARLGQDPWAEAARWAQLPKAAAIDCLARSIGKMPMEPQAIANMGTTAERLILLLPGQNQTSGQSIARAIGKSTMPAWMPVAFFLAALAMGWIVSLTAASVSPAGLAAPPAQTTNAAAGAAKQ